MFYCKACQKKNGWPEGIRMSFGPCEVCKVQTGCYDVPSKYLTPVKKDGNRNRSN